VVVDVVARARGIRLALLRLRGVHRADRLVGLERHAAVARVHFERALRKGSEWRLRRNFDVRVQQSMDARNCAACVPEVFGLPEKERLAYLLLGSRPFLPIPKNTQGVIARDGERRLKVALQWAGMGEGGAYRSPPGKRRTMARMGCGTIPSMSFVVKAIHVVERDRLRRADSPDAAAPSQETSDPAATFSALGRLSAKLKVE
jgi:hypothetical protein